MRLIDADAIYKILESCEIRKASIVNPLTDWEYGYTCGIERAESEIECAPTVDAVPVIRCKDCKHRPTIDGEYKNGFDIIFPDMRCPCQCEDGWYNWMPEEDWFCGNAERREHEIDRC